MNKIKAILIVCLITLLCFCSVLLVLAYGKDTAPVLSTALGEVHDTVTTSSPPTEKYKNTATTAQTQVNGTTMTTQPPPPATTISLPETEKEFFGDNLVLVDVEHIYQLPELPNGCEVTSLAIVLNHLKYDIDKITLFYDYMPRSDYQNGDPWTTYVGSAANLGYGCYAPCVVDTANTYLSMQESEYRAKDVSGKHITEYEKYIDQGIPVIMWGMTEMVYDHSLAWSDWIDGKAVLWHARSHCLVLIGYTDECYIFCDPLEGKVSYGRYETESCFNLMYKQACIIEKTTKE